MVATPKVSFNSSAFVISRSTTVKQRYLAFSLPAAAFASLSSMKRLLCTLLLLDLLCCTLLPISDSTTQTPTRHRLDVPRVSNSQYITILSLEGAGVRGIVSVMCLIVLEDAIKEHILDSKVELLPGGYDKITKEDLDIYLADYFDLISGTASGTWVANYLATKGTDGALRQKLKDPKMIAKYGKSSPGTARALIMFFHEYMNIIFPQDPPPPPQGYNDRPTYEEEGLHETMEALFGENTLTDCVTSCLNPMTDIYSGAQITFFTDYFSDPVRTGFMNYSFSNLDNPYQEMDQAYTRFNEGINFRLQDISDASTAGPGLFLWPNVTSISKPQTRLWGGDGYLNVAGFPAFESVAFVANRTGDTSIEDYAVLSFSNGNAVPGSLEGVANLGPIEFAMSRALIDTLLFRGGSDFANQLDLFYSANSKTGLNQFLRIQFYREAGTVEGNATATLDDPAAVPLLQELGEELAKNYTVPIYQFVNNYIFA